jgi:phosphoribosylformimino-5-aminoimidazole carboxamide ribotide isomerase
MYILPAIDLYDGKAVRLYKGDYEKMTVYSDDPLSVAQDFQAAGAEYIHMVDLAGAKDGTTPNFDTVARIAQNTDLKVEIGGGIRSEATIQKYLNAGVRRVILGTAAITDWDFFVRMVQTYGDQIAAGVDCRDGYVAIKGWLETSAVTCDAFCQKLQDIGVQTLICTDISKDGAMGGSNQALYKSLTEKFSMDIIASGGVSSLEDIQALRAMGLHGAIVGKAYYIGAISLPEAIEVAK